MSIQSEIDRNLTERGRFLHSFVISGESGDANVPKDVHVRFYGCTIGSLNLNGNNNVFLEGGVCAAIVAKSSSLMSRGTGFTGEASLDEQSKADLFGGSITAPWRFKARSFFRGDNLTFSGGDIALDFQAGSQGRVTRSTFSGHGTAAVKAAAGSYALLSNCASVKGTRALWATDRGVIQAIECALVEGTGLYALQVEDYGRIEALNCALVKGAVNAGYGDTYGFLSLQKCTTILGAGNSAIFLDNHAGAEIRFFDTCEGQGDSAIRTTNLNSVFVLGGALLRSGAKDGLELKGGSTGQIVSVVMVKGAGRHGVHLESNSELYVNDVVNIEGAQEGFFAADGSLLNMHDVAVVKGLGSHGGTISGASKAALFVDTIIGEAGHGLNLSGKSRVVLKGPSLVKGNSGHGVSLGAECEIVVSQAESVSGEAGDGINAGASCKVITNKSTVVGKAGNGITAGAGTTVHATSCASILGQAGHGIDATDSLVRLRKVASISGLAGHGIKLVNPDFEMVLCPDVSGIEDGVNAVGRGAGFDSLKVERCVVAGTSTGLNVTKVKVSSYGSKYTGSTSLLAVQAHVIVSEDVFDGDAAILQTVYEERNSKIDGDLTYDDASVFTVKGEVTGDVVFNNTGILSVKGITKDLTATDSALLLLKSAAQAVELTDAVALLVKTTAQGIDVTDAVAFLIKATASGMSLSNAAAILVKATASGMSLSSAAAILAKSGAGIISGSGSVVSALGGTPQIGVDFVDLESDLIKIQDKTGASMTFAGPSITTNE